MPAETTFDGYSCEICGRFHAGQYISLAFDSPDPYARLTESGKSHAYLGTDDCVVGGDEYYLRAIIELPIIEVNEVFLWGAWVRVWQKDYEEFVDHFQVRGREEMIGPYKGRLANNLPGYESGTLNLKCSVQIAPVGSRPILLIDEPDHPLAHEQRKGISLKRAAGLAARVYHKSER